MTRISADQTKIRSALIRCIYVIRVAISFPQRDSARERFFSSRAAGETRSRMVSPSFCNPLLGQTSCSAVSTRSEGPPVLLDRDSCHDSCDARHLACTKGDARGNRCANGYRIGYRFELYFSQKYS